MACKNMNCDPVYVVHALRVGGRACVHALHLGLVQMLRRNTHGRLMSELLHIATLTLQTYENCFHEEAKKNDSLKTLVDGGYLQNILVNTLARMLCSWHGMTETVS
jgi:hypothetical protein